MAVLLFFVVAVSLLGIGGMVFFISQADRPAAATPGQARARGRQLLQAAAEGDGDMVRALLRSSAAMDLTDEAGRTALHLALDGGHGDVARWLMKGGASLETQDAQGRTAVDVAREKGLEKFLGG